MKIVCDIDGTVCSQEKDYSDAKPYKGRIQKINKMFDNGDKITFFTARGSGTGINWRVVTENQLKKWNVKYHKLIFGKPPGDIFIDDRAEKDNFLGEK